MPDAHDGSVILRKEGLPEDGLIFVPSDAAAPLRQPAGTWAFLVAAADVLDDLGSGRAGEVVLFAGCSLPECPPASHSEGDLVVILAAQESVPPADDEVNVEMFLAHRNRWFLVGEWKGLDVRWPWTVATTAAAIMSLHTMMSEVDRIEKNSVPPRLHPLRGHGGNGGLADLLALGLVHAGDEFAWDRGRYSTVIPPASLPMAPSCWPTAVPS
ncbi:hypothetical protein [Amycolatopsis lexingtonensis]|uniref:hypothetical protein n=1 Tax=Amycolatopsis lexingtonensis TaxID=218822 RepID=UPI003F71F2DF